MRLSCHMVAAALGALSLLASSQSTAQNGELENPAAEPASAVLMEESLDGLLIDRTITRIGREFYRCFSAYRFASAGEIRTNLTISERPSARWGSLITVTANHIEVFRSFLQPSSADIKRIAEAAAEQIDQQLQQQKLMELFADHSDLERDEL